MTRLGIIVYGLLLTLMAALSIVLLLGDNPVLLWIEGATDMVLLSGIVLYLRHRQLRWWLYLFFPALAGQLWLLISLDADLGNTLISTIILLPACYLNARIFMNRNRMSASPTA